MKKIYFLILAAVCLLYGCSNGPEFGCIVADIDLDKDFRNDVSIFEIVSKIELIQLDSVADAMVEPKFRLFYPIIDCSGMYFMEGRNNNYVIKHFDDSGVWIENINKCGRGHGEVTRPQSYSINVFDGMLEILDESGKLYRYKPSQEYKFIDYYDLSKDTDWLSYARMIDQNNYLIRAERDEKTIFGIFDRQVEILSPINPELNIPYPLEQTEYGEDWFYTNDGKLKYVSSCDGSIYSFSDDNKEFLPYFKWNLGKYHLSVDDIEKGRPDEYYLFEFPQKIKGQYITGCIRAFETDNQIISVFTSGKNGWMGLNYDKKEQKSYCFESTLVDGKFFYPNGVQKDGILYVVIPPGDLKDRVGIDWLTDETSKRVYDYATANPESNSVIIKYYLK